MPRAPHPALSLLLMAAMAFAATSPPLEIINPWLSACDLQPASATDLQGACSAMWGPGSLCPPPCRPVVNSTTQCLYYLKESHKEEVCGRGVTPENRRRALKQLRMRHCCEHAVDSALPDRVMLQGGEFCREQLDALLEVDALAARISCEFGEVLTRYDCTQTYSIMFHCEHCKDMSQSNEEKETDDGSENCMEFVESAKDNSCSEKRLKKMSPANMRPPAKPIKRDKKRALSEESPSEM